MKRKHPDEFQEEREEDYPTLHIEPYELYYCHVCNWEGEGIDIDDRYGISCPSCGSKDLERQ